MFSTTREVIRKPIPPYLRHIKRDLDMTHGTEVVNFIGLYICDDCNKIGGIAKVSVVKEEFDSSLVAVTVDVINTAGVERRTTTDDSVNLL